MPLNTMFRAMQKQLADAGVSGEKNLAYGKAFLEAANTTGAPLPCPICFVDGKPSRLQSIPSESGNEGAVCDTCHTRFEWRLPE